MSTSFGIVVYGPCSNWEVKETYAEIGANGTQVEVLSVTVDQGKIFAATKDGILKASLSGGNLLDYNSWTYISTVSDR